jgi:prolyl oligopeptidase
MINQPRQVLGQSPKRSNLRISQSNSFRDALSKNGKTVELRKIGAPFKEGISRITIKTTVCKTSRCCRKDAKGTETVFLDPNTFLKTEPHHLADWIFPKTVQK